MELSPDKPKLTTIMPTKKPPDAVHTTKRKSHLKQNLSDFLDDKQKRISKKLSQHFGNDLIDFNHNKKKNKDAKYVRRSSFFLRPQIKKVLLKDYKAQLKIEKKYRKLVITQNLFDSSFEESGEENEDEGLDIYNFQFCQLHKYFPNFSLFFKLLFILNLLNKIY